MTLGVRSYGNTLLTENIFEPANLPDTIPALKAFAIKILTPTFTCTEEDCETPIGRVMQVPEADLVGLIRLSDEQIITDDDVTELILADIYTVRVRDTSSCVLTDGFCRNCGAGYAARIGSTDLPGLGEEYTFESSPRSYQNYLAGTYSGAALGWETLSAEPLPVQPDNWGLITSHGDMDTLCRLLYNTGIPRDSYAYLFTVTDILERALLIIGTYGVYGNV